MFLFSAIAAALFFSVGWLRADEEKAGSQDLKPFSRRVASVKRKEKKGKIIYVTLSQACGCTMDKCREVDTIVDTLLESAGERIAFKSVDYVTKKRKANAILEKYGASFIPVIILLDSEGRAIYKSEDYVKKEELLKALKVLVGEEK